MSELKHYSQMSQDLFADHLLDSSEGYFVDVGCYDPRFINNTYRLEKKGFNKSERAQPVLYILDDYFV